ncbi:g-type lectin s-receptor-like serine/threonine-protein kinase ces101 [Quercus suber]|uniref:G-type lectin s-receptor-like serine/threonine-protein kinase ces101 n=1 Tax=Quercus suber TaxID=58331 RepID=A0AAW0L6S0_QUESU
MSSGRQLWQSFDHPSHVLLPGMKLGGEDIPELGNFTFGLHPSLTNRLVILLNGDIYWTSGYLNSSSPRLTNSIYSFDYISNENETYFNCSVDTGQIIWPQLTIDYLGVLSDNNGTLVNCTSASAYLNEGCVAQLPECRSTNDTFSSLTIEGLKFSEGENLTHKDCEAKCLKNCSCVAYASTNEENQTICEIWSKGGLVLTDGSIPRTIYFLSKSI